MQKHLSGLGLDFLVSQQSVSLIEMSRYCTLLDLIDKCNAHLSEYFYNSNYCYYCFIYKWTDCIHNISVNALFGQSSEWTILRPQWRPNCCLIPQHLWDLKYRLFDWQVQNFAVWPLYCPIRCWAEELKWFWQFFT